jgi:TRAP-type C4-dicarboxylate transport system permease small subunit
MSEKQSSDSARQRRFDSLVAKPVLFMTVIGGALLLMEVVWVSWGAVARYALRRPDPYVTEATALFLMPFAFVGLAYALLEDAFPRVTLITDLFPTRLRSLTMMLNALIMTAVGLFFTIVTGNATWRTIHTGATSNILNWPEYVLWLPTLVALAVFSILAFAQFVVRLIDQAEKIYPKE